MTANGKPAAKSTPMQGVQLAAAGSSAYPEYLVLALKGLPSMTRHLAACALAVQFNTNEFIRSAGLAQHETGTRHRCAPLAESGL